MRLLFLALLPAVLAKCPAGYIWSNDYQTCYSVNIGAVSWTIAETMCMRMGGHLASIRSSQHNSYIYSLVRNVNAKGIWIGAEVINHHWMFSDGMPMIYENFQGQMTDPYGHSVGAMLINSGSSNGRWEILSDQQSTGFPYICETPQCTAYGTAPPSLLLNATIPGMTYGPVGQKFYFGSGSNKLYVKDAQAYCAKSGGYLVSISNAFANQEVLQMVTTILGTNNPSMFEIIIGYESNIQGVWSWMDGNYATYQNWDIGEPFMSTQMFSTMNLYAGKWHAALDTMKRYFLCEFIAANTDVCM